MNNPEASQQSRRSSRAKTGRFPLVVFGLLTGILLLSSPGQTQAQVPGLPGLPGGADWSQLEDPTNQTYSWTALIGTGLFECFDLKLSTVPLSETCFGDRSAEDAMREQAHAGDVWWKTGLANLASIFQLVDQAASQFQSFRGLFNTFKDIFEDGPEDPERVIYQLAQASDVALDRMDQHNFALGSLSGVKIPNSRFDKIAVIADRALSVVQDAEQHNRGLYQRIGKQYRQLGTGDVKFGGLLRGGAVGQRPPPGSEGLPNINVYEMEDELLYPPEALVTIEGDMPEDAATDRPVAFYRRVVTQAKGARMTSYSVDANVRRWRQIIETMQAREHAYQRELNLHNILGGLSF